MERGREYVRMCGMKGEGDMEINYKRDDKRKAGTGTG